MAKEKTEIKMKDVNSSNIKAIGYNSESKEMDIEFHNGSKYRYEDIEPQMHKELMGAESVGAHFNKHFKANSELKYTQVKDKNKKK